MCVSTTGGNAVLQSDQHAATDVGVLQTAPGERRWGEHRTLVTACSKNRPAWFPMEPVGVWIRLFSALSLCNLWEGGEPWIVHSGHMTPCSTMWGLFLAGCNVTEGHGVAAYSQRFVQAIKSSTRTVAIRATQPKPGLHAVCGKYL